MRILPALATCLAAAVVAPAAAFASDAPAEPTTPATPTVDKSATLPAIGLAGFQNGELPGSITADRGVLLGGIGSGLFPGERANEYWTITDRGPNGEIGDTRTFLVPEFTPTLVKVRVRGTTLEVLDQVPITTPAGTPVTGLPNFAVAGDPAPYAADGVALLDYDANGLDTEGVVRTADGHFWVVDEYGPSLSEIDAAGHLLRRFVPAGLEDDYVAARVGYPVIGALPADLAKRRANRGFEDIALLPDGRTVVVALQSSVVVAGQRDRIITSLVEFDTVNGTTVEEHAYQFDAASTFAAGTRGRDLKISALIPVDADHVIVQERTDTEARFYTVALDPADDLIAGADKTLLVNLAGVAGVPGKIEGAALKSRDTLVIISDNDFGFVPRAYAAGERVDQSGVPTVLTEVKLG
jgi:hypothetical protein